MPRMNYKKLCEKKCFWILRIYVYIRKGTITLEVIYGKKYMFGLFSNTLDLFILLSERI